MTQIERVSHMEQILDKTAEAAKNLSVALERFLALKEDVSELEAYYTGPQWIRDYEDDCAGRLPDGLLRGVLSEDAVHELLCRRDELKAALADQGTFEI